MAKSHACENCITDGTCNDMPMIIFSTFSCKEAAVTTPTMGIREDILQHVDVSHTGITFECYIARKLL